MKGVSMADWIVIGEFGVALVALVTFVIGYLVSSGGQALRSPEGRHLIMFRASLAAFMILAIINNLWAHYPGRDTLRTAVAGAFACSALQGVTLLYRAQLARHLALREAELAAEIPNS